MTALHPLRTPSRRAVGLCSDGERYRGPLRTRYRTYSKSILSSWAIADRIADQRGAYRILIEPSPMV